MKKNLFPRMILWILVVIVCLFAAFTIYRKKSRALPVTARTFDASHPSCVSWDQVLKNPSSIKIERLDTGSVRVKKSNVLNLKHPKAKEIADEDMELKVFSYLIHHEEFGDYLVDAGLDSSIQENPYGTVKGIFGKRILYSQEKETDIASQLKKRNIMPKGVFLTHLHYDHTSGLASLPSDMQCYLGKTEPYINLKFLYENDCLKKFNNISLFDFSKAKILEPLGPSLDIFGDGSLWAISTPGHTEGHVSYLVNSKGDPTLITGDASIVRYGIETGVGSGTFSDNIKIAQNTLEVIIKFHKRYPRVKLAFGHDM